MLFSGALSDASRRNHSRMKMQIDNQILVLVKIQRQGWLTNLKFCQKVEYVEFLGDLSPQYYPRRSQLNFTELTGYGVFYDVWPYLYTNGSKLHINTKTLEGPAEQEDEFAM